MFGGFIFVAFIGIIYDVEVLLTILGHETANKQNFADSVSIKVKHFTRLL